MSGCRSSPDGSRCSNTWLVSSSAGAGAGSIAAAGTTPMIVMSPTARMARAPDTGGGHSCMSSYACVAQREVTEAEGAVGFVQAPWLILYVSANAKSV